MNVYAPMVYANLKTNPVVGEFVYENEKAVVEIKESLDLGSCKLKIVADYIFAGPEVTIKAKKITFRATKGISIFGKVTCKVLKHSEPHFIPNQELIN